MDLMSGQTLAMFSKYVWFFSARTVVDCLSTTECCFLSNTLRLCSDSNVCQSFQHLGVTEMYHSDTLSISDTAEFIIVA